MYKYFLIIAIGASLASGCYYDNEETLYPTNGLPKDCDTTALTYDGKIKAIINQNCAYAGCHLNGQSPDLSNYDNVVGSIERVKIRAIDQKSMPPSGASNKPSNCDISLLKTWIEKGMPN